jgi:hypothetical protein
MASANPSAVDRQLARARRRLFLGTFLTTLAWAWVGALALASGWFLVGPFLVPAAPDWLRWAVAGGLGATATLVAIVLAVRRRPSPVTAALLLDERFGLKERVTTSLTLTPEQADSPAAEALLADANDRVAPLRVGDRFPVGVPRTPAVLVPAGVAALLLLAFLWHPQTGADKSQEEDDALTPPVVKADIDKKLEQLARRKKKKDEPASKELERIDADIERFVRKPRDTRDEMRDRIKDATALEDQIKKQQREEAERRDAFRQQMKQIERLKRKKQKDDKPGEAGPAQKMAKAVERADFAGAEAEAERLRKKLEVKDEIERLRRRAKDEKLGAKERKEAQDELERLQDKQLSKQEREKLEQELKDLEDKLERLSRKKDDQAEELREMERKGELDADELERELEQLEKNAEKIDPKDLEEVTEALGECRRQMKNGDDAKAAKALSKAAKKLGKMGKGGESKELAAKLQRLQSVRRAMSRALSKRGGGQGGGRRPEGDGGKTGVEEKRSRAELDKGELDVVGHAPGGGFKGPRKPSEMREEIRQAAQEAPAAIDRQRLPQSAKKMARGYFEKVRGPEGDKKKDKP